jgi:hypothetical protein
MPLEVNAAAVRRSNVPLPGCLGNGSEADMEGVTVQPKCPQIPPTSGGGKSAEVIVVEGTSRGLGDARLNGETGGLTR